MESRPIQGTIADKGYFQEYFHTLLAQKLMEPGTSSGERIGVGISGVGHITDREVELFSKRHELIDTLSEERG